MLTSYHRVVVLNVVLRVFVSKMYVARTAQLQFTGSHHLFVTVHAVSADRAFCGAFEGRQYRFL